MNLLPASLDGSALRIGEDSLAVDRLFVPADTGSRSGAEPVPYALLAGIRPGDLEITDTGGLSAEVDFVEDFGDSAIVNLSMAGSRARMRTGRRDLPGEGARLRIKPRPGSVHLFAADNGRRIEI
jgi:ABC-type sugar transport system ATPase subunit